MKKEFFDKLRLDSSCSLILAHRPDLLTMEQVAKKEEMEKRSIGQFGLFDTATPNFSNYYPDVKVEDLAPKDGEFIRPIFRALSETIVHRKYNPIDFSKNGVLKASMQKLLGQTVYPNHEAAIGNQLGVVSKVSWQNGYVTEDGVKVPAGINAEFKIDGKSHPGIARAIMMDPPAIHSNSVTVSFGWEQSHPKMDSNEFRSKIGQFGADGELIRRIVTSIPLYHETSLVAHGADPFAQLITDDGKIANPNYAAGIEKLSDKKTGTQVYFFNYKTDTVFLEENPNPNPPPILKNKPMKDYLVQLALVLAITDASFATLEEADMQKKINEKLASLQADAKKAGTVASLQTEVDAEKLKVTNLTTELAAEKALASVGKKALDDTRKDVIRMYTVLNGAPDATMLEVFNKGEHTTLSSFQVQYQKLMDEKYPGTCNTCQSTDISRNSVIIETPAPVTPLAGGAAAGKTLSDVDVAESFRSNTSGTSFHGAVTSIHGAKQEESAKV